MNNSDSFTLGAILGCVFGIALVATLISFSENSPRDLFDLKTKYEATLPRNQECELIFRPKEKTDETTGHQDRQ